MHHGATSYRSIRIGHWDHWAGRRPAVSGYYHRRLHSVYRYLVPPGVRILELGCGQGDLLANLQPSVGVGVDFSGVMVDEARRQYPQLRVIQADANELDLSETFDTIILSDLINDLWDVQATLNRVRLHCHARTRVIINFYSRLWGWPLTMAQKLGLATPTLQQNWLAVPDVENLLDLAGLESIRNWHEVLWPVSTPVVDTIANKVLVRLSPFNQLAMSNFVLARPQAEARSAQPRVSVIIPARNEAGNIEGAVLRTPEMGSHTELIFVEGHSRDDTLAAIDRAKVAHPNCDIKVFQQTGKGKADAVRLGYDKATGDILMILDSDLSVPPEDLSRFYDAMMSGRGDFINGVRLVYPMEGGAMRPMNFLGNKFFSIVFSWLLGQRIKDTLCGTKVLWRDDYDRLAAGRSYFGDFDPFGDFDLVFGAAKLGLKIVDLPIRYRQRTYGSTNINRWSHGWLLIKMLMVASRRLKFV